MEVTHDKHFIRKVDIEHIIISIQNNKTLGTELTEFKQSPESDPHIICMEEEDDELLNSLHLS